VLRARGTGAGSNHECRGQNASRFSQCDPPALWHGDARSIAAAAAPASSPNVFVGGAAPACELLCLVLATLGRIQSGLTEPAPMTWPIRAWRDRGIRVPQGIAGPNYPNAGAVPRTSECETSDSGLGNPARSPRATGSASRTKCGQTNFARSAITYFWSPRMFAVVRRTTAVTWDAPSRLPLRCSRRPDGEAAAGPWTIPRVRDPDGCWSSMRSSRLTQTSKRSKRSRRSTTSPGASGAMPGRPTLVRESHRFSSGVTDCPSCAAERAFVAALLLRA
jgi:hypothetical protein